MSFSKKILVAALASLAILVQTTPPAIAAADPCGILITNLNSGMPATNSEVVITPPVSPATHCVAQFNATATYSFVVPAGIAKMDYLVVGGGGGGASGGGGGGGVLQGTDYSVTPGASISVTVGAGGAGGQGAYGMPNAYGGAKGENSIFDVITALGGGGGGAGGGSEDPESVNGASGGGSRFDCTNDQCGYSIAGNGTPGQGNNGGYSTYPSYGGGAGGGGAGGAGFNTTRMHIGGRGGDGLPSSITGSVVYYGGGGGGGVSNNDDQYDGIDSSGNFYQNNKTPTTTGGGQGGLGGGGRGSSFGLMNAGMAYAANLQPTAQGRYTNAESGAPNSGGGGGGVDPEDAFAGAGGSGTVIIRWLAASAKKTVTFHSNTASPSTYSQSVANGVQTPLALNTFTNNGYIFVGWNTAANRSGTAYAEQEVISTSTDLDLYAVWITGVNHTVTFDSNANSGISGSMATQSSGAASALSANRYARSGYTFDGWNTAANGSGFAYLEGAVYSFATDVTLYAQWSPIVASYKVTFYGNGAESGSTTTQVSSAPTALNLNGFNRVGYNFLGWNADYSASTATYVDGQTYSFGSDVNLYAVWVAQANNTITYDGNQADSGTMASQIASSNTQIRPNTFVRNGYTFKGWNTSATGNGTAYLSNYVYSFATSKTLYAQWGMNVVINYFGNTQSTGSAPAPQSTFDGSPGINLPLNTGNLTKVGYRLAGWNSRADGTGTPYALGASSVKFSANTNLYAQWAAATYAVVYADNGATSGSAPTNTTFTLGSPVTLASSPGTLQRAGFRFENWNTSADGSGVAYAPAASNVSLNGDTVLFATWVALPPSAELASPGAANPGLQLPPEKDKASAYFNGLLPNSSKISSTLQVNLRRYILLNRKLGVVKVVLYSTSASSSASATKLARARATQLLKVLNLIPTAHSVKYSILTSTDPALQNRLQLELSK